LIRVKLHGGLRNRCVTGSVGFRPQRDPEAMMADDLDRRNSGVLLGVLIGAAVVALGVLAYGYYERRHESVVRIDVPGFSGEIRKDKGGVDLQVGKDKP
jgi:hypothetical protein